MPGCPHDAIVMVVIEAMTTLGSGGGSGGVVINVKVIDVKGVM